MKYYLAVKRDILKYATMLMNYGNVMQAKEARYKRPYYKIPFI